MSDGLFRDFDLGGSDGSGGSGRWGSPDADDRPGEAPDERVYSGSWCATDGPEAPPPPDRRPSHGRGPGVAGYEILGELGRGAMGVVYKARQLRLNRVVALKMILAGDHAAPDTLERFLAEAATIARLKHPNVVQIYATGDSEGRPFVELELVEGGSLASRLDGTPWPARSAACLIEQLTRAVAEAHRLGIVHRDLKPANILMTDDGTPKVSDFGLAKTLEENAGLTRTESILGSPSYMAPEQAEGRAKEVGPAADIYALGANLYELLTGRPPFVAPTILATLDLVKNADPVPPGRLQPGLPRDIETICLKCLEKEPQRRYESADALADDLESYLNHEPIRARPTPRWERALKWVRRRPSTAALVAVTALASLTTVGGLGAYRADQARQTRAILRRVERIRSQSDHFVLLGREAIRRGDWEGARTQLSSAMALMRAEPRLAGSRGEVERLLALSGRRIEEQQRLDAEKARAAEFRQVYDEAVFYQSDYTGLDPESNLRAGRSAARRALAMFGLGDGAEAGLHLDKTLFDPAEVEEITSSCYELALILADAVAQPLAGEDPVRQAREGLQLLAGVEALRPATPALHLRRAAYFERTGERAAAQAERDRAATAHASGPSAIEDFLAGQEAGRKRDYEGAVAAFQRALMLRPDHFWAQYLLAVCHLKAHRPAEAQAALIACQSRRPGFVWTHLLKGFAEGEMREFDLAEADFQRATELGLNEQERYVMLVNRGVMRIRRGRNEAAADDLRAAIALKPGCFQAYINLAQALQNLERWDDALEALDRAVAAAPGQPVLYRARGQLHRLRSRNEQSLRDLDRAVELSPPGDPMLVNDHIERGTILYQAGRFGEALAACDRALALQADRPEAHRLRGVALLGLKRYDEAVRALDACIERGTPTPALYEARGLALTWSGSYDRAVTDLTVALSRGKPTPSLLANRGWAYLLSGAPGPAARDFDEALRLDPSNGHALGGRALAYVQLRKPREAVADAAASARANPGDPRQSYNAARVYCQAAACLESDPSRLGGAWNAAGRYRVEALALIARALELTPEPDRARFWAQVVRPDSALDPIRRTPKYLALEARATRPPGARPEGGLGQ
jgi:serine/threonine protein kinase/Flp pilus assembly protein TadD